MKLHPLTSLGTGVLAACALLWISGGQAAAQGPRMPFERVERQVFEELDASADGRAYVLVALREPQTSPMLGATARMDAVFAAQQRVLDALAPGELELRYRYLTFAGLTGRVTAAGLERLASLADVEAVGVDVAGRGTLDTSVAYIRADRVQSALGLTGAGVTVAVIDTGVDTDHPDLADDLAPGAIHFLEQGADVGAGAEDDHGHGTSVSGVITSQGVVAPRGVAPDADVLAVKVMDATFFGWLSDWTAGVDWVTSVAGSYPNLCAINMSLGTGQLYSACDCNKATVANRLLNQAIKAASDAGIVTFAASGNSSSCDRMVSPGCLRYSVAVASVDESPPDLVTAFSDRNGACNDLAAPGNAILSCALGGGTSVLSGTSLSTPHCTGVAALIRQAAVLSPDELVRLLKVTGVPTTDSCAIAPAPIRIDAFRAALVASGLYPIAPPPVRGALASTAR